MRGNVGLQQLDRVVNLIHQPGNPLIALDGELRGRD